MERTDAASRSATPPQTATEKETATRSHHGSLRSKLVLSVAGIFFLFVTVYEVVRTRIIEPEFAALEQQGASRDASRVLAAIRVETERLSDLAEHLAHHGDLPPVGRTRATPRPEPRDWPPPDIGRDAFQDHAFRWLLWAASDEAPRWIYRPEAADEPASAPPGHAATPDRIRRLLEGARQAPQGETSGITRAFDGSLAVFATAEVRPRSAEGETASADAPSSWILLGRPLDAPLLEEIRRRTQVAFEVTPAGNRRDRLRPSMRTEGRATLVVDAPLLDPDDEVIGHLMVRVPREITSRATHTGAMARNLFIFGSIAALLLLLLMLQRIVVSPIAAIREHTDRIAARGLRAGPLPHTGNDELGALAVAFDHMTERLRETQRQLSETSRAAGASQVAETVIHNIGNVLTNVNSLLDSTTAHVNDLRIGPLNRLADRLEVSSNDREFLQATPEYLRSLADSLRYEQRTLGELLGTLAGNLRHIHDVIRDQRQHAHAGLDIEPLVVGELLSAAIGCCQARLNDDRVRVSLGGAVETAVLADRSLLSQVFINLIGNAGQALRTKTRGRRELRIVVDRDSDCLRIRFNDNGIGMDRKTLRHAFDAHFTTRSGGSGLGLHFCALTMKRFGGSIRARSQGPGQGATIELTLPLPPASEPFPYEKPSEVVAQNAVLQELGAGI